MEILVDGISVVVTEGASLLDACDQAGRYVPRLCAYPGLGCSSRNGAMQGRGEEAACPSTCASGECDVDDQSGSCCGLCAVRMVTEGIGEIVLACCTTARPDMTVITEDAALRAERLLRLADLLAVHPHICLTCPDRDGCARDDCTFGIPTEARCCDKFGHCEFGKLVAYIDPAEELPRRAVAVSRDSGTEGRIRRESGLCVGCGRCFAVCNTSPAAGRALRWAASADLERKVVAPKKETLRASGCTFCGQCVMVCPTGALTAPGEAGARWLEGWRKRVALATPVLPPDPWRPLTGDELGTVPRLPGVFLLADDTGRVLRITGTADLSCGLAAATGDPALASATRFRIEPAPLFTQRESELLARYVQQEGHLPPGNDLADDLFADDLFSED